jgi:peroxiredoxin
MNTPAPDFELADYTGRPVRLSMLRGKNVLLVFNRTFM